MIIAEERFLERHIFDHGQVFRFIYYPTPVPAYGDLSELYDWLTEPGRNVFVQRSLLTKHSYDVSFERFKIKSNFFIFDRATAIQCKIVFHDLIVSIHEAKTPLNYRPWRAANPFVLEWKEYE